MSGVVVEQAEGDLVKRCLDRRDLSQHVDAVALVLDHPGYAAHLSLHPRETLEKLLLGGRVAAAWAARCGLWFRHGRKYTPAPYSGRMDVVLDNLVQGVKQSLLMAYAVWWALVLGFAISAIVQAWVPRKKIEDALSGSGPRPVALATGLGAASSSCSYAAIAIAKSLFQKGASAASALAFQFASTNLVWELGLVLWVLIGWQFTLAEYVGGIVMIVLMTVLLRLFVSPQLEEIARHHAREAGTGHQHHSAGSRGQTSLTTSAATGRCSTKRSRSDFSSPGSSDYSVTASSTDCSSSTPLLCRARSRTWCSGRSSPC